MLEEAQKTVAEFQAAIRLQVEALKRYVASFKSSVRDTDFFATIKTAEAQYQALTTRLAEQGVANLSQYGTLVQQRQLHRKTLTELDALSPTIKEINDRRDALRTHIEAHREEITRRRQAFLTSIVGNSTFIRMKVSHCGLDPVATEAQWREVLGKPTKMDQPWLSDDGSTGMIADLYRDLPVESEAAQMKMCERVSNLKREVDALASNTNPNSQKEWIKTYFRTLSPETLDRIQLWWPTDGLEIEFRASEKGNDFKPIRNGSPGQRTAAVLAFLLSYGTEPMILDQPEDDLDNQLIYDLIVTQLRENKKRRQVIVVTHNANIVVNRRCRIRDPDGVPKRAVPGRQTDGSGFAPVESDSG